MRTIALCSFVLALTLATSCDPEDDETSDGGPGGDAAAGNGGSGPGADADTPDANVADADADAPDPDDDAGSVAGDAQRPATHAALGLAQRFERAQLAGASKVETAKNA